MQIDYNQKKEFPLKRKKTPGQTVVIITLFIAVMILFTIVLINIYKVSDIKTTTSQISDRVNLNLCSQMGAYVGLLNKKINERGSILGANCAPNWGIIFIAFAIVAGLVMSGGLAGLVTMVALLTTGIGLQMQQISDTESRAFASATNTMTSYTGFRESAIHSMLTAINADVATVRQTGAFQFTDENGITYDLAGSPGLHAILEDIKHNRPVYRFDVWYWGKRFKNVNEGDLKLKIEDLINTIVQHTKIEHWNSQKWEVDSLSFKVHPRLYPITRQDKEWIIDGNTVRITGPVNLYDWVDFHGFPDWFNDFFYLNNKQFILAPNGFKGLTRRLLDVPDPTPWPDITYATKTTVAFTGWLSFLGIIDQQYDYKELYQFNDEIYGFLTRSMELMNIPISYQLTGINGWLPIFYNQTDSCNPASPKDICGRLFNAQLLVRGWRQQLEAIEPVIAPLIPPDWGTHCATGIPPQDSCDHSCCCTTGCCCCNYGPCSWYGIFCSCTPDLGAELCTHGDIYGNIPSPCPPPAGDTGCACGGCTQDTNYPWDVQMACRFQGDLNWAPVGGSPTEIAQTIDILRETEHALTQLIAKIIDVGVAAKKAMQETEAKKEAVYGWIDKNDNHRVVRVRLDNYPAYEQFPAIEEYHNGLFDLETCWRIKGAYDTQHNNGRTLDTKVSSYASDVPAGWWNFRFRKNPSPGHPEFDKNKLKQIISNIQQNGDVTTTGDADLADLMDHYAITSATKGYYGARKEDIYIEKSTAE
jgi:hypothetical protein